MGGIGYFRPDQFLDHLTVKKKTKNIYYCRHKEVHTHFERVHHWLTITSKGWPSLAWVVVVMYEDVKGVAHGADKARLASWVSDSSEPGYTLRPYPTQPLFAYVLWFAITSFAVTKNKTILWSNAQTNRIRYYQYQPNDNNIKLRKKYCTLHNVFDIFVMVYHEKYQLYFRALALEGVIAWHDDIPLSVSNISCLNLHDCYKQWETSCF